MTNNNISIDDSPNQLVSLSDSAVKRIAYLINKEELPNSKLRVSVDGGGCSGFQYKFDFVNCEEAGDLKLERGGAVVLIDEISLGFIKGSIIDYVETLGSANFEIRNPNATAKCGCGNSFAV